MRVSLRVGVALVFVVAMAGCESEPESGAPPIAPPTAAELESSASPAASPAASPPVFPSLVGQYSLAHRLGNLTVYIPGSDDAWFERIRAVASRVSAPEPKAHVAIVASNTTLETVYLCGLSVVDGAGKRITFQFALDYVNGILKASEGLDPDVYKEIFEQWNPRPSPALDDYGNEIAEQGYSGRNPAEVPPGYTVTPGMVATEPLVGVTALYSGLLAEDELLTPRCDNALEPGAVD